MKQTIMTPQTFPYSLIGCRLTSLEKEKRRCRLIFMEGFYKGDRITDGYVEITELYRDSFLMIKGKKKAVENIRHLDLAVNALTVGNEYACIIGENTVLVFHYGGKLIFHTTY